MSALLGMDSLRDNGCVVEFNRETLQAGSTQVKLRNESSREVHRVSLVVKLSPFSQTGKLILFATLMGECWRESREF